MKYCFNEPVDVVAPQVVRPVTFTYMRDVMCKILDFVVERTGVTKEQMKGRSRKIEIVEPRFMAISLMTEILGKRTTQTKIGEIFGRKHSLVIYATGVVDDMLRTNKYFKRRYETLRRDLRKELAA